MKKLLILTLAMTVASAAFAAQASKTPGSWGRMNFLLGEWQGLGSGAPGEGQGGCAFAFELDKKILVRKNWAKYPAKPGETAGITHEDLLIVYPGPGGRSFRAIYFDNEGHTIDYASVVFPADGDGVTFETAAGEVGPRYQLVYRMKADGTLENLFLVAPPGGEFKLYVSGLLKRKGPSR